MALSSLLPTLLVALAGAPGIAHAAQPGTHHPKPSPMRNLTIGQLNFLHTTDTHAWLSGHIQEPQYSGDWGDYISFAQRMREKVESQDADLILVDTGDRVEGNGIYDASTPHGIYLSEILRQAPVDIITSGNHELYVYETAQREHEVTVSNFADVYLSSNLDYREPSTGKWVSQAPQRFRRFTTPKQGIEVLALGFMFEFSGNANNTNVQLIEDTVREAWFQTEIGKKAADIIVVAGHVGLRMPEFHAVYTAIRKLDDTTPVVFFGGHAHVRDATSYDAKSFAMASGRYLETVGWMSVDGLSIQSQQQKQQQQQQQQQTNTDEAAKKLSFTRRYIDNNLPGYHHHTGLNETTFPTEQGKHVTALITQARDALDLNYRFGCAPRNLYLSKAPYPSKDSIYSWLVDTVIPDTVINASRGDIPRLVLFNTGAVRFDILQGPFTRDSAFNVMPFVGGLSYIPDVPYTVASKVLEMINGGGKVFAAEGLGLNMNLLNVPEHSFAQVVQPSLPDAATEDDADATRLELRAAPPQQPLAELGPAAAGVVGGHVTYDDIGADGDDTVHTNIPTYALPNCVQATLGFPAAPNPGEQAVPEKVDLVFVDFLTPWIVMALRFAGGRYALRDVLTGYVEASNTQMLTDWIEKNWRGEC